MDIPTQEQLNALPKETITLLYLQLALNFNEVLGKLDETQKQNAHLIQQVDALQENVALLIQNRFGRKTEKVTQTDGQYCFDLATMSIINEAELLTEKGKAKEPEFEEVAAHIVHHRPKGKQEEDLRAVSENIQDCTLPKETLDKLFPDGYTELPPSDSRPLLEYTPAEFQQIIYRIHVYKGKDGTIVRAPHPDRLFKGSIATPSIVSATMNAKYVNAVPLERYSKELANHDIHLSRELLASWMIMVSERYFYMLYDLFKEQILKSRLIHCDETPFVVVRNGRDSHTKDYMWVYHTGPAHGSPPIYIYQYCPTRKMENPEKFLEGYAGILMTDGYQVYHSLEKKSQGRLKVAGCWAHAKRKYSELRKSLSSKTDHGLICIEGEKRISAIYAVDNLYKNKSPEERLQSRKTLVKPLVDAYFTWVKEKAAHIDQSSPTGKALQYSINQETFLRAFLDNAEIPLDNNDAEISIKKFCVGKKNWQIADTKNGAEASGVLYSIAETAIANGLKPYYYFKYVLEEMILHQDGTDRSFLQDLLPWSEKLPSYCKAKTTK